MNITEAVIKNNTDLFFSIIKKDSGSENPYKFKIAREQLLDLFARNMKLKGSKMEPDDIIRIGREHSPFVKENSLTTAGIFIVNKKIFEPLGIFGYINKSLNGGAMGAVYDKLATALLNDDVTVSQCADFIQSSEWLLGGPISHIINPSVTELMLELPSGTAKLKEKLLKEHAEELEKGNTVLAAKIEKMLCDDAWDRLKNSNDPCVDVFEAGCGLDFYNNYKTMFIMKGPVKDNTDPSGSRYNIITSDLDKGITKKDFVAMADSGVLGAYSTGVATGESGYYTKKYNAMYQNITLLPKDSDCKTKKTVPILIQEGSSADKWSQYHYHVKANGELELLTPENISKYYGKILNMRTPLVCEAKKPHYCNKCYGDLSYKLGKLNVGQTYSVTRNSMMNEALKKKHDVSVKLGRLTANDFMRNFK